MARYAVLKVHPTPKETLSYESIWKCYALFQELVCSRRRVFFGGVSRLCPS